MKSPAGKNRLVLASIAAFVATMLGTSMARATAPQGRYTVTADTVYDNLTRLTWQRAIFSHTYTQAAASSYCQSLILAGLSGWRLPTVNELQTIVDERAYNPAIDTTTFPNTPVDYFWTSSPVAFNAGEAWVVIFNYGDPSGYNTTNTYSVRCVR